MVLFQSRGQSLGRWDSILVKDPFDGAAVAEAAFVNLEGIPVRLWLPSAARHAFRENGRPLRYFWLFSSGGLCDFTRSS
jgi:hypothetical protein